MSEDTQIHPDHNVYILGAGFSRDARLPLMYDFLDRMRDSIDWLRGQEGRERELEEVYKVFQFRLKAAAAAYRTIIDVENIEQLFSLASASVDESDADYISLAIAATLDYAKTVNSPSFYELVVEDRSMLEKKLLTDDKCGDKWKWRNYHGIERDRIIKEGARIAIPVYDLYAGIISGSWCATNSSRRNTVITFNYDTLLEEAFERISSPYEYPPPFSKLESVASGKTRTKNIETTRVNELVIWLRHEKYDS